MLVLHTIPAFLKMSHDTALLLTDVCVIVNLYKYNFTFLMCTWTCIGQCCNQRRHSQHSCAKLPAVAKDSASKTDTTLKHSLEQNLTSLRTRLVSRILRTHTRTCTPKAVLLYTSPATSQPSLFISNAKVSQKSHPLTPTACNHVSHDAYVSTF